jgi:hypothetical protein
MDIGSVLNDSIGYAKDAVWGKWARWILLIIASIIFPLIFGYVLEMLRGKKPAPEPKDWVKLFIDGIKIIVIGLIYLIPTIIIGIVFIGAALVSYGSKIMMGYHTGLLAAGGLLVTGIILMIIVTFIVELIGFIGAVRFARMGRMGEAFNFNAILALIGKIGWGSYIIALIVLDIILIIIRAVLTAIPIIGWLLNLIVAPALFIFAARYVSLLYDSVPAAAAPAVAATPTA